MARFHEVNDCPRLDHRPFPYPEVQVHTCAVCGETVTIRVSPAKTSGPATFKHCGIYQDPNLVE